MPQEGNRYIPPTFNYGSNAVTNSPDYQQMNWNTMQQHYLPGNTSQGQMGNAYMQQLQSMLGQFGQQYGDPNRRPVLPNFGSYNPGFGGATSYYDQQAGTGGQKPQGSPPPDTQQRDLLGQPLGSGGGEPRRRNSSRGEETGAMPQFNPYQMMQRSMRGMNFNQMFDPRFADLFGASSLGSRVPNGPPPQKQPAVVEPAPAVIQQAQGPYSGGYGSTPRGSEYMRPTFVF